MTKIDIISGFLGAGKTTLIKKLLQEGFQGEKIVLIENEFGEIGIDGGFLKDAGVEITEMNSGCICCSLVGDFSTALQKVLDQFSPDRIIIEPSGVGKLSDVIKAVQDMHNEQMVLNSFVTVADASKCKMYMKNFGEFFNNQVEYANTIVLSRTQNMKEDKLELCIQLIREKNANATIITTPWDDISGAQILAAMEKKSSFTEDLMKEAKVCTTCGHVHEHDHEEDCGCGHHHHEHDHEEGCGCGHHHHEHDHEEGCGCGHHHHEHDHEEGCGCGHHHHEHDHDHEEGCGCGHHHHGHHHADEVFTSWGVETPHKFTTDEMKEILEALANTDAYGSVLRAKGIVQNVDGSWIYYDLVPGEYELRTGAAEITGKICVIGTNLVEEKLKTVFHIA
ncbi:MAG: GTP-binding protein [Lachnospiraceae bacterium]|nr:GTP-binding protein [Lachnospiraceae bacterium]